MSARGYCLLETTTPANREALAQVDAVAGYIDDFADDDRFSIPMTDVNWLRWDEIVAAAPDIAWIATLDRDCEEASTIWVYHQDMDRRPVGLAALSDGEPGLAYADVVAHAGDLSPLLGDGTPWWWYRKVSGEISDGRQEDAQ